MFLTLTDIKDISVAMSEALKVDFTNYNTSFLKRRVTRAIEKLNLHKVQELINLLKDPQKAEEVAFLMQVPCTELFRDPAFWRALRKNLTGRKQLSVWFPHLTNGYELYSLMILLKQIGIPQTRVVASTFSQLVIDKAKQLNITSKIDEVNRYNFERLEIANKYDEYVDVCDNVTTIKPEIISSVEFHKEWYINEKVEKYDLIIFRNVTLNYNVLLHERAIERLVQSLNDDGLLTIGIKEVILPRTLRLNEVNANEGIYGVKKQNV